MKTSHTKTPRTLAECEFNVGYREATMHPIERDKAADLAVAYVLTFAAGFFIAYLMMTA